MNAPGPLLRTPRPVPAVVTVEMGYGHLRAAWPIATALGTGVLRLDLAPFAGTLEQAVWGATRLAYESVSRASQGRYTGAPALRLLEAATAIPGWADGSENGDRSRPNGGLRLVAGLLRAGVGRKLTGWLEAGSVPLVTTYFVPAHAADRVGHDPIYCVVTDIDVNRVWAPVRPRTSRIRYLVPHAMTRDRLLSYGVLPERIEVTGFPLPSREAVAGQGLRSTEAPLVVIALGGAGAGIGRVRRAVTSLAGSIRAGVLRLAVVAGTRRESREAVDRLLASHGLDHAPSVEVLYDPDFATYYQRFNALIGRSDALWTKPSEMTFYGALGVPLILAPPVGVHERANRQFLIGHDAAVDEGPPEAAATWLLSWLRDGTLARTAANARNVVERHGTERIVASVQGAIWPSSSIG